MTALCALVFGWSLHLWKKWTSTNFANSGNSLISVFAGGGKGGHALALWILFSSKLVVSQPENMQAWSRQHTAKCKVWRTSRERCSKAQICRTHIQQFCFSEVSVLKINSSSMPRSVFPFCKKTYTSFLKPSKVNTVARVTDWGTEEPGHTLTALGYWNSNFTNASKSLGDTPEWDNNQPIQIFSLHL